MAGFDDLLVLDAIDFTPFDYQIKAARTALRRFRGRGLLSDEVGLGKTIEAGLVLKEYLMRQMVQRAPILTPPGLVEQWRVGTGDQVQDQRFRHQQRRGLSPPGSGCLAALSPRDRLDLHRTPPRAPPDDHRRDVRPGDRR